MMIIIMMITKLMTWFKETRPGPLTTTVIGRDLMTGAMTNTTHSTMTRMDGQHR